MTLRCIFVLLIALGLQSQAEGAVVRIGELQINAHDVGGILYALDDVTFFIENFTYDGAAPAVHVYVYERGVPLDPTTGGIIINWQDTSTDGRITRRYNGDNVTVSLRDRRGSGADLTVESIGVFTIWCQTVSTFFATINIPSGLILKPAPPVLPHCAQLSPNLQVSWLINSNYSTATFELCSCITSGQYMSFGLSGSDTSTFMVGADVVVAWIEGGRPYAVDYHLSGRVQCRDGSGVCPDSMSTGAGANNVANVSGLVANGQSCVRYSRPLETGDTQFDKQILTSQSQFIAWAIGPRLDNGLVLFHTEWPRNTNVELNFGTGPGNLECSANLQCVVEQTCGWTGETITTNTARTFRVRIGPSGGNRGYEFITGQAGWGIAFYIDDMLIPKLRLRRGVTYTFIVEAGNNVNDGPNYHPFYITNSPAGGVLLDSAADRMRKNEVFYAGYDAATNTVTAAGRHCQHMETSTSASVASNCDMSLRDYTDTLEVSCQGPESDAATLTWTPDENTPDTVYYQCANHLNLGWQIEVSGEGGGAASMTHFTMATMLIASAITYYLFSS